MAIAGLSMFEASIVPPLTAPAPTMVWISSMKRIAFGFSISAVDDRLQPLLELAAILRAGQHRAHVERPDVRVLQHRRAPCLRRSCSASPSAIAVLPTPGSPTNSGLFLRRRQRIWIGALELGRAADERIDLALFGALVEIDGEQLERIAGLLGRPFFIADEGRLRRGRVFADAVREVLQHVQLVHALAAQQVDGLRPLGLIDRRQHLAGVDFLLSRRLGVQLRVLHDPLQHGGQHRLHLGVIRQLLERPVHEVVELLAENVDVAAAGADDARGRRDRAAGRRGDARG